MSSVNYRWVLASYDPRSTQGKAVLAHAGAGIGYRVINKQRTKMDNVIVAFKYAKLPVPAHLTEATPAQVEKLERYSHGE